MKSLGKFIAVICLLVTMSANAEYCSSVRASHILVKTEKEAYQILAYINKGQEVFQSFLHAEFHQEIYSIFPGL